MKFQNLLIFKFKEGVIYSAIMVVLHYKRSEQNQFLYETTTSTRVEDLIDQLCRSTALFPLTLIVNNLRIKLDRTAVALEELASKGPLKPEEIRGLKDLDDYVKNEDITTIEGLKKMPPKVGVREVKDDTNYRTGWILGEEITKMMLDEAMKAKGMVYKTQAENKVCLTFDSLQNELDTIRGLVMMAYPAYHGLGDWEPVRILLENQEILDDKTDATDDLFAENATLWICGKEL